jgi:uncharacterized protein
MMEVAQKHGFHFDTVQMPINIMDAHFRSFSQLVVPEAVKQRIGVLGMKCFGSGVILKSGVVEPTDCLHYSLNLPISVLITGINTKDLLNQAFAAVRSFQPMDQTRVAALISKTQDAALNGKYELFKTTAHFDTTARHPDWLGSDSPAVQQLAPQLPG